MKNYVMFNKKFWFKLCFAVVIVSSVAGCGRKLSGEGPPYFTTAFQCDQKHSETGWCFATPSKVYSTDYRLVGDGSVQDYLIPNGKICVANANGCVAVLVELKDRS